MQLLFRGTENETRQNVNQETSKGLDSKETVVLRRWGHETQNFGFIN